MKMIFEQNYMINILKEVKLKKHIKIAIHAKTTEKWI